MSEKAENTSIVTGAFRLAFPEVFAPKASGEDSKEKFSVTMLFPKDGSSLIPSMPGNGLTELRKLALATVKAKWGNEKDNWPSNLKALDFKIAISSTGQDGWPIRDGDTVTWDGFGGMFFVRASSQFQPGLVNAKLQPILDKADIYGGLICRAQVNCFAYDNAKTKNRGVSFGINNLQILKDDGVTFGGKQNAAEVFDAFGDAGGSTAGAEEDWG